MRGKFISVLTIWVFLFELAGCTDTQPVEIAAGAGAPSAQVDEESEDQAASFVGWSETYPDWVAQQEPFQVIENIYYVGSKGLASFLITTPDGHILLDGTMAENVSLIIKNIETLGFDIADVKYLLNSHAHFDHSGGLAGLKEKSGAQMIASEADRSALEGGFYLGSEENEYLNAPPVKVDRIIADVESVTLGDVSLTATLTPGHTRGCTSWTMKVARAEDSESSLDVLFFCSASVALNRLVGSPQYEGIVDDYRYTFEVTRNWQPDVFLSNHPEVFGMAEKRQRQIDGDGLAFVDHEGFPVFIARAKQAFEETLARQQALSRE